MLTDPIPNYIDWLIGMSSELLSQCPLLYYHVNLDLLT
jgi:hypothetical protein